MSVHPAVANLVESLRKTVTLSKDPKTIVTTITPTAIQLAEDKTWLKPEYYQCDYNQGMGITILNEEDDHSILVETVAWLPGRGVSPHDHQTWGLVVGIDGTEINVNWQRIDDGTSQTFAELQIVEERAISQGDAVSLMPEDIHSVRNEGDKISLSLHIYGKALSSLERYEFDPINKTRQICPQRIRRE